VRFEGDGFISQQDRDIVANGVQDFTILAEQPLDYVFGNGSAASGPQRSGHNLLIELLQQLRVCLAQALMGFGATKQAQQFRINHSF
jgi:hypothetical protein